MTENPVPLPPVSKSDEPKTDAELKQLAMDAVDGRIFTSFQIQPFTLDTIGMVFVPVMFLKNADDSEWLKGIGAFYEYISEASSRSINGYPCFMSMKTLSVEEAKRVVKLYNRYLELKKAFMESDDGRPSQPAG